MSATRTAAQTQRSGRLVLLGSVDLLDAFGNSAITAGERPANVRLLLSVLAVDRKERWTNAQVRAALSAVDPPWSAAELAKTKSALRRALERIGYPLLEHADRTFQLVPGLLVDSDGWQVICAARAARQGDPDAYLTVLELLDCAGGSRDPFGGIDADLQHISDIRDVVAGCAKHATTWAAGIDDPDLHRLAARAWPADSDIPDSLLDLVDELPPAIVPVPPAHPPQRAADLEPAEEQPAHVPSTALVPRARERHPEPSFDASLPYAIVTTWAWEQVDGELVDEEPEADGRRHAWQPPTRRGALLGASAVLILAAAVVGVILLVASGRGHDRDQRVSPPVARVQIMRNGRPAAARDLGPAATAACNTSQCPPIRGAALNVMQDHTAFPNDDHRFLRVGRPAPSQIFAPVESVAARTMDVRPGQVIRMAIYYDNGGDRALRGVAARFVLPVRPSTVIRPLGLLTTGNGIARVLADRVTLRSPTPVTLVFRPDSAFLRTRFPGQTRETQSWLFPSGVATYANRVDYDRLPSGQSVGPRFDGRVAPGSRFSGYLIADFIVAPGTSAAPIGPAPDRTRYACSEHTTSTGQTTSCHSADHATLNSAQYLPAVHDESDFVKARVDVPVDGRTVEEDPTSALPVKPGDIVEASVLVHNNGPVETAVDGADPARGTRVRVTLLEGAQWHGNAALEGFVSADNTVPAWVSDGASVYAPVPIRLRYLRGTARWAPQDVNATTLALPDDTLSVRRLGNHQTFDVRDQLGEGALVGAAGTLAGSVLPAGRVLLRFRVDRAPSYDARVAALR
jgi:hypothetical protein